MIEMYVTFSFSLTFSEKDIKKATIIKKHPKMKNNPFLNDSVVGNIEPTINKTPNNTVSIKVINFPIVTPFV